MFLCWLLIGASDTGAMAQGCHAPDRAEVGLGLDWEPDKRPIEFGASLPARLGKPPCSSEQPGTTALAAEHLYASLPVAQAADHTRSEWQVPRSDRDVAEPSDRRRERPPRSRQA